MTGIGVDLHPYYQRGVTSLPGVEYGWIKMADGAARYVSPPADALAALFRNAGIPFGGYVYAQPGDGAAEARVLWAECQRLGATGVAPACDIENNVKIHTWTTQEAIDHGRAFCAQMRSIGVRPAIYMSDSLARDTKPGTWPEDPVLWIARYGGKPQFTRYDVHQYADNGTLPGAAAVDMNQSYSPTGLAPGTTQLITADWIDMATQAEVEQAVEQALRTVLFDVRFADGRNFGDEAAQQTGSLLGLQAQLDKVIAGLDAVVTALGKLSGAPAGGATAAEIATAVADEEAKRLQS